ncbi:unnamed protein product, partial [Iphiclides podalirius]
MPREIRNDAKYVLRRSPRAGLYWGHFRSPGDVSGFLIGARYTVASPAPLPSKWASPRRAPERRAAGLP